MALIIEDGSIVPNANSYISLADARTFLQSMGYDLDADDTIAEQTLIKGYYYVSSFESSYQGERISADQTGSFPRSGVYINGFPLASDEIPVNIQQAQSLAAYEEQQSAGALFPNTTGQTITSEEVVGAVKVSYSDNGMDSNVTYYPQIESLLKPLFSASANTFRVFRV